jgi:GNAT superfamily N-acetyltransferase
MNSAITIREATEGDIAAVLHLYVDSGLDDAEPLPLAAAVDIFRRMKTYPYYRLWVAEDAGRMIGTYALLIMETIPHAGAPSAIVEQVAVASAAQGTGVGKLMMQHAMDEASAAGCYKLHLSSNMKRKQAHAFYESLGFERHGYSYWTPTSQKAAAHED